MFKKQNRQGGEPQNTTQAAGRQMRYAEDGVTTHYAGAFNIGMGAEEMVFIFGNPAMEANVIRIETKVAVTPKTAKRIALTLINLLQQYEAMHGELDVQAPQPMGGDTSGSIM